MKVPVVELAHFSKRVFRDFFFRNNGLLLTSAVAHNTLLSLIPLAAVLAVVFSQFFDDRLLLEAIASEVALVAPGFESIITDVVGSFLDSRDLAGWIGVIVLLFFSSVAFRMLENAIGIIFHRPTRTRRRRFWVSVLLPYLFIFLIAGGLIILTTLNVLVDFLRTHGWVVPIWGLPVHEMVGLVVYITGVLGLILLFTTLYQVMPATRISFRLALSGGVTAALLWEIMRHLLTSYFSTLSLVNVVYGSLATTIIALLTLEAAALIVLLGAQIIADLQDSLDAGIPWYADPGDIPDHESSNSTR